MPFWTYMLHCHGGYFYVGHTDDIDRRIGEHKFGLIPGFTADHQPVELVWSDQFANRDDAKAAERKLRGWSRVKKLALIRGDWDLISDLARKKDSASTSSAWTGKGESSDYPSPPIPKPACPELVERLSFPLLPHPETPLSQLRDIIAKLAVADGLAWIVFEVTNPENLVLAKPSAAKRTDGLWQHTCFELFVAREGGPYHEFNFSPSGAWAAYRFDSYRKGMGDLPLHNHPVINCHSDDCDFTLIAALDAELLPPGSRIALSAVIEERDGTKSYWALAHPPGQPDFHHPTCFAATLPAPKAP